MNYKFKRNLAGLGPYFVAKEIGISYDKYREVENKKRSLNEEQLDKFSTLTGVNKKEAKLNYDIVTGTAVQWLKENTLPELVKGFNMTMEELSEETGISKGTLYDLKSGRSTNKDKVLRLFDFFNDKSNKRVNIVPKVKKELESTRTPIKNESPYDFKGIINALGFTSQTQLEGLLGLAAGNITWWKKGRPIRQTYLDTIDMALQKVNSSLAEFTYTTKEELVIPSNDTIKESLQDETEELLEYTKELETSDTESENTEETSVIKESEVKNGEGKYNIEDETVTITIEDYIAIKTSLSKSEGKIIELKREIQFLRSTIDSLNTLIKK